MIKIIIDSSSDFTEEQAKKLGLIYVPMSINFGEEEYLDGVTLVASDFYTKLQKSKGIPKTSLINSYRWSEVFEEATADGSDAIVLTLSSKLSGTYRAAVDAATNFNGKVIVVDSLSATYGMSALCLYALELTKSNLSAREIADKLEEKKKDIRIFAVIDTLEYLKKGGRISATTAFVGTLLSIKPIISVVEGEVKVIGKAFGNKKGNAHLISLVKETGGIDFDMPCSFIYSGNDEKNIKMFQNDAQEITEGKIKNLSMIGCTIGTHIGPGGVGIVFFKK